MTDPTSRFPYLLSEPDETEREEREQIEREKAEERADFEKERD